VGLREREREEEGGRAEESRGEQRRARKGKRPAQANMAKLAMRCG
jgi:hypothetical protein